MKNRIYLVDGRYFDVVNQAFGRGRIFLPTVCHPALPEETAFHPDMALCPVAPGQVVCAPELFETYRELLAPFGIAVLCGETALGGDYPGDIAYNVLITEYCAFSRADCTDKVLKKCLKEQKKPLISVSQGYARCSTLSFGTSMITADPTLCGAGKEAGLTVLSISPGHILLPGYDYGFIGGASGLLDGKTICFFGGLDTHPEGVTIRKFIENQGFSVMDIPGKPLTDIGTVLCIEL
ncbi:MAG: hypothetical protein IJO50_01185 [Clostridia bacterium]|nr:hypothetical protein [Clostridia bacterium]